MPHGPADPYVVEWPRGVAPAPVTATLRDATGAGAITVMDIALGRTDSSGCREIPGSDEFADEFGWAGVRPTAPGA